MSSAPGSGFQISLAEWSLHHSLFAGQIAHMDFPAIASRDFDIHAVELVNTFFKDKARDRQFLTEFKSRAQDAGVKILLIMCDHEGALGDPDQKSRHQAAENHFAWVEAAHFLGCHSIRVNAHSKGTANDQAQRSADGIRQVAEFAQGPGINILIENHGGLSSNAQWLVALINQIGMKNCGTLPDFGNFRLGWFRHYDRYRGVEEMMPLAKAVSAKSQAFDREGNETRTDYLQMMRIVLKAGYHGYVGIEYSGSKPAEPEGIRKTKALLERVRDQISAG